MKILIIGGTKFFGRHLVEELLTQGHEVCIFTRGNVDLNFSKAVKHIKGDRKIKSELEQCWQLGKIDVIYDQICFNPSDAKVLIDVFNNKVPRLIFTSTASVYDITVAETLTEEKFDFKSFPKTYLDGEPYDYQWSKRTIEKIYSEDFNGEVAMVRFPIVIGEDDPTGRFKWHIDRIKNAEEIFVHNPEVNISFVFSKDAGKFLAFLADKKFTGAINACSDETIKWSKLISMIEAKVSKKVKLLTGEIPEGKEQCQSPFGFEKGLVLSNQKARHFGFTFSKLHQICQQLVDFYTDKN